MKDQSDEPGAKRPNKSGKKPGKKRNEGQQAQPDGAEGDTPGFHRVENSDDPRSPEERGVAVVHLRDRKGKFVRAAGGRGTGNPGNSGGKKGRSGTYSKSFKRFCRNVLRSEETKAALELIAKNPTLPGFAPIIKLLAERGYGPVEKTVAVKHTHLLVHVDV